MRASHRGPHWDRDGHSWPPEAVEAEKRELEYDRKYTIEVARRTFRGKDFACDGLAYAVGKGMIVAERCFLDGTTANRLGFSFVLKGTRGVRLGFPYCPFCGVKMLQGEAQCTLGKP